MASTMWNPIDAIKAKFPNMGLSDSQIFANLSDPAKFRSAFPEFDGLSDSDIHDNMQKIALTRPDIQAPAQPAGSGVPGMMSGTVGADAPLNMQPVAGEQTPEGHQAAVNAREDQEGPVGQLGIGFAKGANETARGIGLEGGIKMLAGDTSPNLSTEARTGWQVGGKASENIMEFIAGDGALKALGTAERLKSLSAVAQVLEKHPLVAEVIGNAMRQGIVGGGQALAHGEDLSDAARTGLITGGLGAGAELLSAGLGAGAKAIGDQFSKVTGKLVPGASESVLRGTAQGIADEAGVSGGPYFTTEGYPTSTRDVFGHVADNLMEKSKGLYDQIDAATGNQLTQTMDRLKAVALKMRSAVGDEEVGGLLKEQAQLEARQEALFAQAAQNGVKPEVLDAARATYRQASALEDVNRAVQMSTKGIRPEYTEGGIPGDVYAPTPEAIDPKMLLNRLQKLNDSGRLLDAAGGDKLHIGNLMYVLDKASQPTNGINKIVTEAIKRGSLGVLGGFGGYHVGGLGGAVAGFVGGELAPLAVEKMWNSPLMLRTIRLGLSTGASASKIIPAAAQAYQLDQQNNQQKQLPPTHVYSPSSGGTNPL